MKSSSDKSFADFIGRVPRGVKLFVLFALAAVILITALPSETEPQSAVGDEERIAALCSMIEGVGECRAVVTYEEKKSYFSDGERSILAVAVICEGGSDIKVKAEIKKLVSTMFGIGTNRIEVLCAA